MYYTEYTLMKYYKTFIILCYNKTERKIKKTIDKRKENKYEKKI